MKKIAVLLFALTGILLSSCQKEYTCECFNPGGVFKTHTIKGTKNKAKNKCSDYSKEYQDGSWNETGCALK